MNDRAHFPLPPGDLDHLEMRVGDQQFLLKRAAQLGPIFKGKWGNQLVICVADLETGRRLMVEHAAHLKSAFLKFGELFPNDFLRNMEGDIHRKYRKIITRAVNVGIADQDRSALDTVINNELSSYATENTCATLSPKALAATMDAIATGLVIELFLGISHGSDLYRGLSSQFSRLGPDGWTVPVSDEQRLAFSDIRQCLLEHMDVLLATDRKPGNYRSDSVLQRIAQENKLDETLIGNLIFMVEIGRFDLHSLLRWVIKYVAEHARKSASGEVDDDMARAMVLETLRLNQSERLMRIVKDEFNFDGYHFPRNTLLRVCLWESHKCPHTFPEPFEFNPQRFTANQYDSTQYAPFGLDHHQCPASKLVVNLASLFVSNLTGKFEMEIVADGSPVLGRYHWQPSDCFSLRLRERQKHV